MTGKNWHEGFCVSRSWDLSHCACCIARWLYYGGSVASIALRWSPSICIKQWHKATGKSSNWRAFQSNSQLHTFHFAWITVEILMNEWLTKRHNTKQPQWKNHRNALQMYMSMAIGQQITAHVIKSFLKLFKETSMNIMPCASQRTAFSHAMVDNFGTLWTCLFDMTKKSEKIRFAMHMRTSRRNI